MNFVFMLTRDDRTIANGHAVLAELRDLGLRHIGCKDVGIDPAALAELHRAMKSLGATTYLECVGTTPQAAGDAARLARDIGFDRLLGGTRVEEVLSILAGSHVQYLPFPGRPFGHPTQLAGSPAEIEADCRRFEALGAAGVDLLAYRATEADPIELVRAARRSMRGTLLVAGGVRSAEQVRALAAAGADAFTVGSAAFDGSFAPDAGPALQAQLKAVLDACT
jgi:hypothetical protein